MPNIPENIRAARLAAGIDNQSEAARQLDITNVHLCNLEADASAPSLDLLRRMAKLYKTTVSQLTEGE